jgi:hypothetical protein
MNIRPHSTNYIEAMIASGTGSPNNCSNAATSGHNERI